MAVGGVYVKILKLVFFFFSFRRTTIFFLLQDVSFVKNDIKKMNLM